ncbi:HEAT repeat domain-containing protein [Prolixibacter sp. SD074]|uniref:HEAT repeat domain-containing protein n=1 Tax=Prolixibacter sp. SD074 TaxID=2652391 RepID=UPI00127ED0F9|nr:HEAT repeat domain-containing protein [Prolixibacter sp. SD074]GET29584.1 hypothetical protein SD074_17860 [Prolixibacter sp. SD074]
MGKEPQKKKILTNLQSEDPLMVIETIKELRETGNSSYIPVLVELLHSTDNPEIRQKIIRLLAELKYSDAIPRIVEAINNKRYASELKELVSICWENSLDFSPYLSLFVDLVIESEFMVAFEAFTVIENMVGEIDALYKNEQVEKLRAAKATAPAEKMSLLEDLERIIPEIPEQKEQQFEERKTSK